MASKNDLHETFYARDRTEWSQWLAINHQTQKGIWLLYYKKGSGMPRVSYDDAVEEALCFGWIDTTVQSVDAHCYKQLFVPRKPKSTWSKLNKQRVEKLIAQGLMTEAGLQTIEVAKQNGMWESLDEAENLVVPPDFAAALENNPIAKANFEAFSMTAKKTMLWRIYQAKRPETRQKRVEAMVVLAYQNKRPT